jgi:hypothetical protein
VDENETAREGADLEELINEEDSRSGEGPDLSPMDLGDAEPVQVDVVIQKRHYVLREADGESAVKYRNASMRAARMSDGKVVGVEGAADCEPLLVSLCLYQVDPNTGQIRYTREGDPDKRYLVPLHLIKRWPSRIQRRLFDKVKEISDLGERPETEEQLVKEIGRLQRRLKKLREDKAELTRNGQEADPTVGRPSPSTDG